MKVMPAIVVVAAVVIVAAAAAVVVPVVAIGKMNDAVMGVAGIAVAGTAVVGTAVAAAVAAATARNSSPRADTGSSPVGRASSLPFHNTTLMSDSGVVHNCRPSPTSYRPHVRASTDSRLYPCGIPCSQHHPPICVFLPSPADPSLHNSENTHKSLTLVPCISLRTSSSICTKDVATSSYNSSCLVVTSKFVKSQCYLEVICRC